ncbi:MAG: hypothetical protein PVH73_06435 [Candidatus Bathyarchaeota archaeon]|jgi:hypothetical protein
MKKKFCTIIMVAFIVILLVSVGAISCVSAQGGERISWSTGVIPTIDGEWTTDDEWTTNGEETPMGEGATCRSTWDFGDVVMSRWLVEFFTDTTDDAEDYWEFCIDGLAEGGSAPAAGDFKFVITGHTDLVWYEGDGSGWVEVELDETEIEWACSLSDSPTNGTAHWILEFQIPKNAGTVQMDPTWNLRIAVYDASNAEAGELAWPEGSDADDPSGWGMENYSSDVIPEGLSFGIMVLLSSATVIGASVVLRKRSKK